MLPDQTGSGADAVVAGEGGAASGSGRCRRPRRRAWRRSADRSRCRASSVGARSATRRPISRSRALIVAVSSRIRPTSSRAIRATVPGAVGQVAARARPGRRPGRGSRAPARRPDRARGGASAGGSGPGSARRRGPRGGRPGGAPRARAHRAWPPAGPARASAARATARASIGSLLPGSRPSRAGTGHQLGRHPDDAPRRRAAGRARQAAATGGGSPRGRTVRSANRAGPADELEVAGAWSRATVFSASLRPVPSTATDGVGALVQIDADDDHLLRRLLIRGDAPDRSVDTPEWGRLPRSYQVTPAGPIHVRRPADPMEATPVGRAASVRAKPPDTDRVTLSECSRQPRGTARARLGLGARRPWPLPLPLP